MFTHGNLFNIIIIILILIIASLFSFLETSIVAVSEHRLKILKEKFIWANYAYKLKIELNQVLIFSLFGNSLFNAIFTTITTILAANLFSSLNKGLVLPATTLCIAFLIIIFSEVLPKIIAASSPANTLSYVAIPLYYIYIVSKPLIWLIDKIVHIFTRLIRIGKNEAHSLEELKSIIADKRSPFKDKHREILLNSLEMEYITIKEVLIPLRKVEAIDISSEIELIYKKISTTHHTRIIIYDNKIDNIIGFIHIKDILALEKSTFNKNNLLKIIRPIDFVSDFMSIIRQIHRAQKYKNRIFVVINEYGDISGIACLEDMLEMIFGDFTTESPQQKNLAIKTSQNQLIVDGTMLIRELNELHDLDIEFSLNALTVNGILLKILNGIPDVGVCFKLKNLVFEVINVGAYWVERVKITIVTK